jgi:hypothetical protein
MSDFYKARANVLKERLRDLYNLVGRYEQVLLFQTDPLIQFNAEKTIGVRKAQIIEIQAELDYLEKRMRGTLKRSFSPKFFSS